MILLENNQQSETMGNSKINSNNFGGKIWCSLFGHDYSITKNVTEHFKEYTCKHCQNQLTNNAKGKIILMTEEYKEINETLALFYQKRHHLV